MYGYGGAIYEGKEIFRASITLSDTRMMSRDPVYYNEFKDGIYDATFLVRDDNVTIGLIKTSIINFDLGVRDQQTGAWKGYLSYENMEVFFKYWDIVDRMVLIEKYKQRI